MHTGGDPSNSTHDAHRCPPVLHCSSLVLSYAAPMRVRRISPRTEEVPEDGRGQQDKRHPGRVDDREVGVGQVAIEQQFARPRSRRRRRTRARRIGCATATTPRCGAPRRLRPLPRVAMRLETFARAGLPLQIEFFVDLFGAEVLEDDA